jgi:hypothetical protein
MERTSVDGRIRDLQPEPPRSLFGAGDAPRTAGPAAPEPRDCSPQCPCTMTA